MTSSTSGSVEVSGRAESDVEYARASRSSPKMDEPSEEDPEASLSTRADDVELAGWAAWEALPSHDRLRTTVVRGTDKDEDTYEQLDVGKWGRAENNDFLNKILKGGTDDNGAFLQKIRERLDKVTVKFPTIEVRFENLTLESQIPVGDRYTLPNLKNAVINAVDRMLGAFNQSFIKKQHLTILRDISGILKPGRMSLLLGPPGSGRTSLLLALSGSLGHGVKQQGKITYNGFTFDEFVPLNTSSYVGQNDLHSAEFTVRETLDYAARYQGIGTQTDLLSEVVQRENEMGVHPDPDVDYFMKRTGLDDVSHDLTADYVIKILGLDRCSDSLIGSQMTRGISGGEKKRVTIGELLVGPARTLFMDEITNGLDSFTTFQIIRCLRQFVHTLDMTIFITLLQPAPEVFNLFDDVMLISEGQIVYQGPRENVEEFFESCGFRCPPRKGIADFLQEVTSRKDQAQYWIDKSKPYEYVPVEYFNKAYTKFHTGIKVKEELATPYNKSESHKAALSKQLWLRSNKDLFRISLQKEILFLRRTAFIYVFKTGQVLIQGLVLATLFFHSRMHHDDLEDARMFSGALFATLMTLILSGFADVTLMVNRLPVFYKLRDMRMIPGWAFGLSTLITRLPFSVIESLAFAAITYYPMNFAPNAGRFFRTLLLYSTGHLMMTSLFRLIAGACRTPIVASSVGSMVLVFVFMTGGYIVPRSRFKDWWIWGYWISPFSWCLIGVFENEFLSPQWNMMAENGPSLGKRVLHITGFYPHGYWYWISIGVIVLMALLSGVSLISVLGYVPAPRMSNFALSDDTMAKLKFNLTRNQLKPERSSSTPTPESTELLASTDTTAKNRVDPHKVDHNQDNGASLSSSSKSASASLDPDQEAESTTPAHGMVLPFQPLAISFSNVSYFIDMPSEMKQEGANGNGRELQLLKDITGAFRPGILTALVGATGAGKSTLMDVLCGRKTRGRTEGDIRISGFPKDQHTFTRVSGYCEQNDVHSPRLTVYESISFSARLRLPSEIARQTKKTFVEEVLNLVELANLRNSIVGLPGISGLSTGQRKLLSIAVELVANPSIIFMDEPTTGLDARAAAIVMRAIRNTVDTGRTVVCTIHQPSINIFESFDELLLLKLGGQAIYAGPLGRECQDLVRYFQDIPGIPHLKEGENPAAWMLEITTNAMENKLGVDFATLYKDSPSYQGNKARVNELSEPPPGANDLYFPTQYAQSFPQQLLSNLWKHNITYWRTAEYNNVRYVFTILIALFFGTMFWHIGQKRSSSFNINTVMGSAYAAGLLIGILMAVTVQPLIGIERGVFYREQGAGMYGAVAFTFAQVLIEIPYTFLQAALYALITYSTINLEWKKDKFFLYFYYNFCIILSFVYYGMMAVGLTATVEVATVLSSFWFGIWNIFSGFIIAKPRIPKWWSWYYWANPLAWHVYGTIVSQFGDLNDVFIRAESFDPQLGTIFTRPSIPQYIRQTYGLRHKFLGLTVAMSAMFPVVFAAAYVLSFRFLNFQKR